MALGLQFATGIPAARLPRLDFKLPILILEFDPTGSGKMLDEGRIRDPTSRGTGPNF